MSNRPLLREQRSATVTLGDQILISSRNTRKALVISAPSAGFVTISFIGPAVLGQGINIFTGTLPLQLVEEGIGEVLREEIHLTGSVGGATLGWLDIWT